MESKAFSIENRNRAYRLANKKHAKSRTRVYEAIKLLDVASLDKVCFYLDKPKNELSGRITELKDRFKIKEVGSTTSTRSNNKVTLYKVIESEEERIERINRRYIGLRHEKDDLINDYNMNLSTLSKELLKKKLDKLSKEQRTLEKLLDKMGV